MYCATTHNVDWATFPFSDAIMSESGSFSVNKPYPFNLIVIVSESFWGWDGEQVALRPTLSPTPISITSLYGYGTGGNVMSRSIVGFGVFKCAKNTNYTCGIEYSGRRGGQTGNSRLLGIVLRNG